MTVTVNDEKNIIIWVNCSFQNKCLNINRTVGLDSLRLMKATKGEVHFHLNSEALTTTTYTHTHTHNQSPILTTQHQILVIIISPFTTTLRCHEPRPHVWTTVDLKWLNQWFTTKAITRTLQDNYNKLTYKLVGSYLLPGSAVPAQPSASGKLSAPPLWRWDVSFFWVVLLAREPL